METKRDIRKMMTALRAAMSEKERAEAGRIIAARSAGAISTRMSWSAWKVFQ